ncbi:MAG: lysophospholipid acyltransferase family protein [Sphingomonadaceae bacterium]
MALALARTRRISLTGWLRATIRIACMALLLIACVPLYYLHRLFSHHNPWPRVFLAGVAWIAGVDLTYRGSKAPGRVFLLANHVSWIDIPALAAATGTAFVGHDGLASMPLLKWLCAMADTVFVARHDRASVARQVDSVRTALSDTGALAIFPEGTTSDGTGLHAFKSSLLSAIEPLPEGIAVQPVLLHYGSEAPEIAWIGEEHGLDNFLRILARGRPVKMEVRFLAPLSGAQLENRKTIALAAREAILSELQG